MKYQTILLKFYFGLKGAVYYEALAMWYFHVKIIRLVIWRYIYMLYVVMYMKHVHWERKTMKHECYICIDPLKAYS